MNIQRRRSEAGLTLIELLIAITVSGIVMSALSVGYVSALRGTQGLHERFVQSHDAQLLAVHFPSDVQSADPELVGADATAAATTTGCAGSSPGDNVLRLQWTEQTSATTLRAFSASYRKDAGATPSDPATLTRYFCTGTGNLTTPSSIGIAGMSTPAMSNPPNGDASNPLSIDKPVGLAAGQFLLAHVTFEKGANAGTDLDITPTGWTLATRSNDRQNTSDTSAAGNGTNIGQATFYKFATAADVSSASPFAFPFSQPIKGAGIIWSFNGVDTTNPIDAAAGVGATGGVDSDPTAPSVVADGGSYLMSFFGVLKKISAGSDYQLATPTGMTQQYHFDNPQDVQVLGAYQTVGTSGSTGTRVSDMVSESEKWVAQNIALKPSTTSTPGFPAVADILSGVTPSSKVVAHHLSSVTADVTAEPDVSMTLDSFESDTHANPFTYTFKGRMRTPIGLPYVVGISRVGDEVTSAATVSWTVTFSESVTGVNAADFDLVPTGVTGASITGVAGSGTTWTVVADNGSGTGTLGLNLDDDDSIVDAVGSPLAAADGTANGDYTGPTFTITAPAPGDTTPPTVTINQATGQVDPTTSGNTVDFTVVFSEAVTGFTADDVTLSGTAGGTKTKTLSGTGPTYTITVSGATSGTLIASIAAGVADDTAGNDNQASTSTDDTVTINPAGIAYQSSSNGVTTPGGDAATSLSIPNPAGVAVGDFLLAQITFQDSANVVNTPTGWTLVDSKNNGSSISQAIFRRTADSSDLSVTSYTFTFSQAVKAAGGILRYTGVDTTNPIVESSNKTGDSTTLTANSVSADAGSILVAFYGIKKTTTLSEPNDGMTSRYFAQNTQDVTIRAREELRPTAGTTGNRTSTAGAGDKWVAHQVTLRAAP